MPAYSMEKYESGAQERIVYWVQTKHQHNADMISEVARRLGAKFGGHWSVRANSYRSNQSAPPAGANAVSLDELPG